MVCLVTGAAGFIGSALARRLLDDGRRVIGIDCLTPYYDRSLKLANLAGLTSSKEFSFIEWDLAEMDIRPYLVGVDWVFHEAAQPGVRASWGDDFVLYVRHNVLATQRVLEAAKDSTIKRLIYASSSSVYGDSKELPLRETALPKPISPYGVTKLAGEQLCHAYCRCYGVPCVSLRYFTVYGPGQRPDMAFNRFAKAALTGESIVVHGDGEQTRDFTFVADAVEGNLLAATASGVEGEVFNIGGGSRVTINHVLEILQGLVELPLNVRYVEHQKGDVQHTHSDTTAARAKLGYQPKVGLPDGLAAEVEWMKGLLGRNL